MARMCRPGFWIFNKKTEKNEFKFFPTYRELKSKLKAVMIEYSVTEVTVYRSRRGHFGEYFEHYFLTGNNYLYKSGEGWM